MDVPILFEERCNRLDIKIYDHTIQLIDLGDQWVVLHQDDISMDQVRELLAMMAHSDEFIDYLSNKKIYLSQLTFQEPH